MPEENWAAFRQGIAGAVENESTSY